ncbi:hypothetical protein [Pantoea sp. 18069]|uniref:hypothetical protein n=1 Tax=Pantoea sp. 18069 TaxID=2681415 RepID=UPI001356DEE4|nr:hypothetical protein [Pantoea sp. 18069]
MTASTYAQSDPNAPSALPRAIEGAGVSWAAIFAGALAAAALSLLLFILGIGLGLSSISVWSGRGVEGETFGWTAVAWFAFTQLASAGVGGYIAGRLRTRWLGVQVDEVYFRDTAHGFLAWSLATLMMVALMGSVAGSAISGTAKAAGAVASSAATVVGGGVSAMGQAALAVGAAEASEGSNGSQGASANRFGYWVDSLFRPAEAADASTAAAPQGQRSPADVAKEVTGIYAHALQTGTLPEEDARYVAQLIAERTGLTQAQAQERVQKSFEQTKQQIEQAKAKLQEAEDSAKQAAETARKAAAHSLLWLFVALLVGAFVASLSATWGGRQRDAY